MVGGLCKKLTNRRESGNNYVIGGLGFGVQGEGDLCKCTCWVARGYDSPEGSEEGFRF